MSETIWQPSLLYPERVHVRALSGSRGKALCDAELDHAPVRCALCSLLAHGYRTSSPEDIRERLEADCADTDEPAPSRLQVLSDPELDTDLAAQYEAAWALDPVHRAIVDALLEGARVVRALGWAQPSSRAERARAHLMETLVALEESLGGQDDAQQTLRHGHR